jgi:hypothetical protein
MRQRAESHANPNDMDYRNEVALLLEEDNSFDHRAGIVPSCWITEMRLHCCC